MWAYRKGSGIIPSDTTAYGGDILHSHIVEDLSSYVKIKIKRSEIYALDKPSQRCDPSGDEPSVAKCFEERFVEKYLNCSFKRLMSSPMLGTCNITKLGSENLIEFLLKVNKLDEKEIFEMTGCMPGCSKSKIELVREYQDNMVDNGKKEAEFRFIYYGGEYDIMEEYYIYNWGSFIADVGGYLGLLLGSSVLSMYHMTTPFVRQQMKRLQKKMFKEKKENC